MTRFHTIAMNRMEMRMPAMCMLCCACFSDALSIRPVCKPQRAV